MLASIPLSAGPVILLKTHGNSLIAEGSVNLSIGEEASSSATWLFAAQKVEAIKMLNEQLS